MWWYQRLSYVVNMLGRVSCSRDLSGLYQSLVIPAFTCGGVGDFRLLGIYLRQGDALEARSVVASTVHVSMLICFDSQRHEETAEHQVRYSWCVVFGFAATSNTYRYICTHPQVIVYGEFLGWCVIDLRCDASLQYLAEAAKCCEHNMDEAGLRVRRTPSRYRQPRDASLTYTMRSSVPISIAAPLSNRRT
jgi:hypothetical protein